MTASPDTVFGKILRKEIPAQLVHEDDRCIVIRDIAPKAPVHLLVIPKEPLANVADAGPAHEALLGHLLFVAQAVAKKEKVGEAFRIVINNGEAAGQSVHHLHVHVLGGRPMKWPPGLSRSPRNDPGRPTRARGPPRARRRRADRLRHLAVRPPDLVARGRSRS